MAKQMRLSVSEQRRMMRIIRDMVPRIPDRPANTVDKEIEEIRTARRSGGRGGIRKDHR